MQFDPNRQYRYVGRNVQIGSGFGGMKPVAQAGTVAITHDGVVAIFNGSDQLIDQSAVSAASTKPVPMVGRQTVFLFLGDKRYSITIDSRAGQIASGQLLAGPLTAWQAFQSTPAFVTALAEAKAALG